MVFRDVGSRGEVCKSVCSRKCQETQAISLWKVTAFLEALTDCYNLPVILGYVSILSSPRREKNREHLQRLLKERKCIFGKFHQFVCMQSRDVARDFTLEKKDCCCCRLVSITFFNVTNSSQVQSTVCSDEIIKNSTRVGRKWTQVTFCYQSLGTPSKFKSPQK